LARRSEEELNRLATLSDFVIEGFRSEFEVNEEFRGALLYATGRGRASNTRTEVIDGILNGALNA
jgi:hypothetical protein